MITAWGISSGNSAPPQCFNPLRTPIGNKLSVQKKWAGAVTSPVSRAISSFCPLLFLQAEKFLALTARKKTAAVPVSMDKKLKKTWEFC